MEGEGEGRWPLERVERKEREGVQLSQETRKRVQSSCCSIKPAAVYPPPSTSLYACHTHTHTKQQYTKFPSWRNYKFGFHTLASGIHTFRAR